MKNIKSISVKDKDLQIVEDVTKIGQRDGLGVSGVTIAAWTEYVANHKDGNSSFTLDQFDTDGFMCSPAFYRPLDVWKNHIDTHRDQPKALTSIQKQANAISTIVTATPKSEKNPEQTLRAIFDLGDRPYASDSFRNYFVSRDDMRRSEKAIQKKMKKLLNDKEIDFSLYPIILAKDKGSVFE